MLIRSIAALMVAGIAITAPDAVMASEIRVLSIPFKGPLDNIIPRFEHATGHKLAVKYAPSGPLLKLIDAAEPFDVVLIFPHLVDELIKQGKVAQSTRVNIARAGLGLVVKRGASKPDIRSTDAFKRVLLLSQSIAYAAQGPSGTHLMNVLDRLGITQEVKPKLKPMEAGSLVAGPVARGEVEMGVVAIPFILAEPGAELAGPLPQELQDYVRYSSGVATSSQDARAAQAFVGYFREPRSIEELAAHGLEPIPR
jgi:molybdate transport system substrate-binding protein